MISCSLDSFESLPPELLETILGFLDVPNLCTTRLVCKRFCVAASRFVRSLELFPTDLRCRPEPHFKSFPGLTRVSVFAVPQGELRLLALPAIRDAVTHLDVEAGQGEAHVLSRLPNLRSLSLRKCHLVEGVYQGFPYPLALEDLSLGGPITCADADRLTALTRLTSLDLYLQADGHGFFQGVTALTRLRTLKLYAPSAIILCVGQLAFLTHLCFHRSFDDPYLGADLDLAPLKRLQRLLHLDIGSLVPIDWAPHHLATLGAMTTLGSLRLSYVEGPMLTAADASLLTPLSHLTALSVSHSKLNVPFLFRFNLERLQSLTVWCASKLEPDLVAMLRRATGLTRLDLTSFCSDVPLQPLQLGLALSCMSKLEALSLEANSLPAMSCFQAIELLTDLTSLTWGGGRVTNAQFRACLGLTKLRLLSIMPRRPARFDNIARDTLFALAKLPVLTSLEVSERLGSHCPTLMNDIDLLLGPERHAKGWPPLYVDLEDIDAPVDLNDIGEIT